MRWLSRLVTVSVIVVLVGGLGLLIYKGVPDTTIGGDFQLWVKFRDASRVAPGSPVVIAGVRVGDVRALGIDGKHARVELELQRGLSIPDDSFATRRSDSLFGDSYIEIIPGESKRLLASGDQILHVEEGGSTDTVLRAMARAMPKIDNALQLVHEFMVNGRKWVNGRSRGLARGRAVARRGPHLRAAPARRSGDDPRRAGHGRGGRRGARGRPAGRGAAAELRPRHRLGAQSDEGGQGGARDRAR